MILAVDVHYTDRGATAAGILFRDWVDAKPSLEVVCFAGQAADYLPGKFYLRELPPIMKLIEEQGLKPDCVVVDGFVYLDGRSEPGLGMKLFDALGGRSMVIGVAKSCFKGIGDEYAVRRGSSRRPLYVTAAGIELARAKECIMRMHGTYRLPAMLGLADRLARESGI